MSCEFDHIDNEIRDAFVSTCTSIPLKKKLLNEETLTLEKLLKFRKEFESITVQPKDMEERKNQFEEVASMQHKYQTRKSKDLGGKNFTSYQNPKQKCFKTKSCFKSGRKLHPNHLQPCQAKGRVEKQIIWPQFVERI